MTADLFTLQPTDLPDVAVIVPRRFEDERGWFGEVFNARWFREAVGFGGEFAQINQSRSVASVIRGLHYQVGAGAQGKLIRVVDGEIYDVAVDLRRSSPDFGRHAARVLTSAGGEQMWVPAGHGHGFAVLSAGAEIVYQVTAPYDPAAERSVRWDDPHIAIPWPVAEPILSERDRAAPLLADAETYP